MDVLFLFLLICFFVFRKEKIKFCRGIAQRLWRRVCVFHWRTDVIMPKISFTTYTDTPRRLRESDNQGTTSDDRGAGSEGGANTCNL
jgi:hypothetical protein